MFTIFPPVSINTEVSHPVHLATSSEEKMPSAFIPFCAFKTQMGILPPYLKLSGLNHPVCTQFQPTTLDGQQCYQFNMSVPSTGTGKENGLMFVIDVNEERSKQTDHVDHKPDQWDTLDLSEAKGKQNGPMIYINTLSPFSDYGGGSYKMTSLKKITCTDAFHTLPEEDTACNRNLYEECLVGQFYTKGEACKCIPLALKYHSNEVRGYT